MRKYNILPDNDLAEHAEKFTTLKKDGEKKEHLEELSEKITDENREEYQKYWQENIGAIGKRVEELKAQYLSPKPIKVYPKTKEDAELLSGLLKKMDLEFETV